MVTSSDPPAGAPTLEPALEETKSPADSQPVSSPAATDAEASTPRAPVAESTPSATQPAAAVDAPEPEKTAKLGGAPAAAPSMSINDDDGVNPLDFDGSVDSNNALPSPETIRKIEDYVVLDRDGKSHPFKSLYTGNHVARRVLVIFVRHFFCGNCQEYLRTLSESITPEALLRLPISTFIAVVGCGDPGLIGMYAAATACPFPIYADPTRRLYADLGMVRTLALGSRPAYMRKSLLRSSLASIAQGLRQIGTGLVTKAGDQRQIGGEFLFEPAGLMTPLPSPLEGANGAGDGAGDSGAGDGGAGCAGSPGSVEEKKVTWCHRMKNTRDHAEIPELMEVLGLNSDSMPVDVPAEEGKRWSRAAEERKGTGVSLASQMATMKAEAAVTAPGPAAI